ncbi:uncharacterized protein LOC116805055 [Drosophila grimshawi]|uniref:uncharacterized protein LOC116805055 n=1 Tax=Drosophila grimshawi TaxID=7222 RepID=UPI000C86FFDC|nr:uncharacterized protein LOC116805055 [Drosophila grimshawi]
MDNSSNGEIASMSTENVLEVLKKRGVELMNKANVTRLLEVEKKKHLNTSNTLFLKNHKMKQKLAKVNRQYKKKLAALRIEMKKMRAANVAYRDALDKIKTINIRLMSIL